MFGIIKISKNMKLYLIPNNKLIMMEVQSKILKKFVKTEEM